MCELTGSFSLAPEVNRKRRGLFSQDIWEWWTEGGHILLFFLTAVGAFWKVREFELGPGESVTSVANHMPGQTCGVQFLLLVVRTLQISTKLFVVCPWRNGHDC